MSTTISRPLLLAALLLGLVAEAQGQALPISISFTHPAGSWAPTIVGISVHVSKEPENTGVCVLISEANDDISPHVSCWSHVGTSAPVLTNRTYTIDHAGVWTIRARLEQKVWDEETGKSKVKFVYSMPLRLAVQARD